MYTRITYLDTYAYVQQQLTTFNIFISRTYLLMYSITTAFNENIFISQYNTFIIIQGNKK